MSNHSDQFHTGFFTMSGALVALSLFYPMYHAGQVLCHKVFRTKQSAECKRQFEVSL